MAQGVTVRPKCPSCGSENTVPIFYGYPDETSMERVLAAVDRGEIELGGCCISEDGPTGHCKNCGRYFRQLKPYSNTYG